MVGGEDSSSNSTASYDEILRRAKRSKRGEESPEKKQKKRVARITLYRNGFTIGDGAFREKSDPVNRRFLESLARGEIPRELEENDRSDERVVVELKDKRLEDYTSPSYVAFQGSGRSLKTTATTPTTTMTESKPECLEVDESKPSCRIQVQLPDRSRIVVKCNETSTVRSFRNHVAFVSKTNTAFELLHGFPPKPISHESDNVSVKEAGLSGSRVIQRILS